MPNIEDRLMSHGRMLQSRGKGKQHKKMIRMGPIVENDYKRIQRSFSTIKDLANFLPKRFIGNLSEQILDKVILRTPDIGEAKAGWKLKVIDDTEILVMNETDEIKFIEYGSSSHIIRPKDKSGVLAFEPTPGRLIFVKHIKHPGTSPQWPMRITVKKIS